MRPLAARLDAWGAVAVLAACLAVPFLTADPFLSSLANQAAVAIPAALSVYLMLRMNLLTFAVPAFMAVGGYAVAIAGLRAGITDVLVLGVISFVVPVAVALPLGVMVLRLRGVYFVLVTFLLTQITQLLLFMTPGLTGGSNGLIGMPATTLLGLPMGDNAAVLLIAIALAMLAALITAVTVMLCRQHFAAIEENETLAESLGLVVWRYKVLGFVVAAGLSGMAGFSLVNMLLTAHPTSFSAASSVTYIAYVIIGGRFSPLGAVVGSVLLVWMSNLFSAQGQYSQGLFGLLLILCVLAAPGGIAGAAAALWRRMARSLRATRAGPVPTGPVSTRNRRA